MVLGFDQPGVLADPCPAAEPGFGAKFEEILVVEKGKAYWLAQGERGFASEKTH